MTRILLVRHGESGANKDKFFAGHLDIDLSELGYKQAKCTADYIAKMTGNSLKKKESLREINAGEWQGLAFDELQKKIR